MFFVPHTDSEIRKMLEEIGVKSMDELFTSIPDAIRVKNLSELPEPLTEQEAFAALSTLAENNLPVTGEVSFIGGGLMRMYRPAVIQTILSRSEFITSYTPYQAEISQGLLQAIFEYQTMVCELLGMHVANASSYDGATAAADALVIARDNFRGKRNKVLVADNLHPEIREVMKTYNFGLEMEWADIPSLPNGRIDGEALKSQLKEDIAAVFLGYPTRHGVVEDLTPAGLPDLVNKVHDVGALAVAVVNPLACAALKSPGDLGFDMAVAEGQPLGIAFNYGGPYLGIFAVKEHLMRRMPGRISGRTVDVEGRLGYILTLQAREQHIRRERATSNICSNQSLCALTAAVFMTYYGKHGLPKLSRRIMGLTQYAKKSLESIGNFELVHNGVPHFHEFVVRCPKSARDINDYLLGCGIIGGLPLDRWGEDENCMLLSLGDENTIEQIDELTSALMAFEG